MELSRIKDDCLSYLKGINDAMGVQILTANNVAELNKPFNVPNNKRWYEVSFMPSEPAPVGIGEHTQERIAVLMQIDIHTPLNNGTDESDDKVSLITQYFQRGTCIGDAEVENVYLADERADTQSYKAIVRVNLIADIDR